MAKKRNHAGIYGPYSHRSGWIINIEGSDGSRTSRSYPTYEEAKEAVEGARAAAGCRTLGTLVQEFLADMVLRGRKPGTIETARHRLTAFLRLCNSDLSMSALTHVKATEMYKVRCTEVKVDTHRAELAQAQALCRWAIKQGHATTNPFDGIEPVGRKSAGKDQLRVDEARRFLGTALADPTPEATAVALALLTGARASEVVDRVVRDLDDGGRLLHIPAAKTRAGIRQVGVPECVRARLLALADGKARDARLFPDLDRYRLRLKVRGLCKAAGVPVVTTHGLRGVHATVAVRHVSADIVARELGQTGAAVTRRHYIAPGTEETQRAAVLESTLTETSAL